jgi:Fe-S cluster biogenesis protein NfuA
MSLSIEEHQQRAARIEALLQEISMFPDPDLRATTEELIRDILDLHGEGLARMLALIAEANEVGNVLLEQFVNDGLVSSLLLLHGLHPVDMETRIRRALDEVRPSLKAHGGNVELVRIADGVAYVRLMGNCHGCSASTGMLKAIIEEAINQVAPDLDRLEMEEEEEKVAPLKTARPVTFIPPRRRRERENGHASIPSS